MLQQILAIFGQHRYGGVVHRIARLDALHEHITRAVRVLLHHQAEVGDKHEALRCRLIHHLPVIFHSIAFQALLRVFHGFHPICGEKEQTARSIRIRRVRCVQCSGKVDDRVAGLILILHRHRLHVAQEVSDVGFIKIVAQCKVGVGKIAF